MEALELVFRFLHFLGLALLIGGGVAVLAGSGGPARRIAFWGAAAQFLTGIVLFVLHLGDEVNHLKITVKLVVVVIIIGILHIKRLQKRNTDAWLVVALGALNTGLAVFW